MLVQSLQPPNFPGGRTVVPCIVYCLKLDFFSKLFAFFGRDDSFSKSAGSCPPNCSGRLGPCAEGLELARYNFCLEEVGLQMQRLLGLSLQRGVFDDRHLGKHLKVYTIPAGYFSLRPVGIRCRRLQQLVVVEACSSL